MPKSKQSMSCSVEGCHHPVRAKGLCANHYNQSLESYRRFACVDCGCPVTKEGSRCHECYRSVPRVVHNKTCGLAGCGKRHYASGYCKVHFNQWYTSSTRIEQAALAASR